jgi:glycosyltransferase involved in cell wall biosynthesis
VGTFAAHVQTHTVVLPQQRVLFLPMPKAACTSMLWTLAELAGLGPDDFAGSTLPEPSAELTVHDMNAWAPEHRFAEYEGEARRGVLSDDGWLRFTVVRDPWRRLWSGWLSKLLLREPRFVAAFGEQPWFPRLPERPADVVEDFRRFVDALGAGDAEDVHWAVQRELSEQLPLDHIGRVERLGETLGRLYAHAGIPRPASATHRNVSPLALPPHAFDDGSAEIVRQRYAADFAAFGYDDAPPAGGAPAEWERRAATVLPLLRATIDEHVRVAQLHRLSQRRAERMQSAEAQIEAESARRGRRTLANTNIEGHADFNVRWGWAEGPPRPGTTAVVRVKNEARALPWTLPPLLRAVDRVVLVDNGSTDGTAAIARETAVAVGAAPLEVVSYPFAVARCGREHLATPDASVHSLAYFYNWSFAHVRTTYALKWDGDMVLSNPAVLALRDLAWQLEAAEAIVRVPRLGLYVADERLAFVDMSLRNCEAWAWPNRPGYRFVKALEWELPMFPPGVDCVTLPEFSCVELKFLDGDEFGHWSPTDFDISPRTARKRREQAVFRALLAGEVTPEGVVPVEAPAGIHVIDYVRRVWLPAQASGPSAAGGARAAA